MAPPVSTDAPARRTAVPMLVAVPVVDLRAQPVPAAGAAHDDAQETQLLYGERVLVLEQAKGWSRLEAEEQPEFTHHQRWEGYPGWVPSHALLPAAQRPAVTLAVHAKWAVIRRLPQAEAPVLLTVAMGTWLAGTGPQDGWWRIQLVNGDVGWLRQEEAQPLVWLNAQPAAWQRTRVIAAARRLLGDPYRWGGRSPYHAAPAAPATGADCSGLVHLAYRTIGQSLPRDAHEQYLRSRHLQRDQLQPGDLIFLSKPQEPQQIVHVLLYTGQGRVLEGPGTGERVRETTWPARFGLPFNRVEAGQTLGNGQTIAFGAYLP